MILSVDMKRLIGINVSLGVLLFLINTNVFSRTQPVLDESVCNEITDSIFDRCKEGTKVPNFILLDIHGVPFALSSLSGKYVVLDFWGSWCAGCIRSFPKMKEYYKKYRGKFEIVGINRNDSEEKWKAAVENYELPWLQVRQAKDGPQVAEDLGVIGYPTQILISPEGIVLKKVLGDDPMFYQYLDELFGS